MATKKKTEMVMAVMLDAVASSPKPDAGQKGNPARSYDLQPREVVALKKDVFDAWEASGICKRAPDDPGYAAVAKAAEDALVKETRRADALEVKMEALADEFESANGALAARLGVLDAAVKHLASRVEEPAPDLDLVNEVLALRDLIGGDAPASAD